MLYRRKRNIVLIIFQCRARLNLYTYCINNPLIYVDPTGHDIRTFAGDALGGYGIPVNVAGPGIEEIIVETLKILFIPLYITGIYDRDYNDFEYVTEFQLNLPKNPDELLDEGWIELTDPRNNSGNHRIFNDPKTGIKVRFDKGDPGKKGWKGKDHYHIYNPDSISDKDYYLDKGGNPVPKNSEPSHIKPN